MASAAPDQVPIAKRLVKPVANGRTAADRKRALLRVMRRLGVAVVDHRGRRIVRGASLLRRSPLFYDFEISEMVARRPSDTTRGVDTLAAALNHAGLELLGGPLSAAETAEGLRRMMRYAVQRRRSRASLPLLLIRELGRAHRDPVDLARRFPPDQVKLDRVQESLILLNLAVGLHAQAQRRQPDRRRLLMQGGPCKFINDWHGFSYTPYVKWSLFGKALWAAFRGKPLAATVLRRAAFGFAAIVDVGHALAMAGLIDFTVQGPAAQETHYGPAGSDHPGATASAGKPMRFTIKLVSHAPNRDDLVISCGDILGFKLPPKGPIEGVGVSWDNAWGSYGLLARHGTIDAQTSTQSDGTASLTFTPSDEFVAGGGRVRWEEGSLRPAVHLYFKFVNLPGLLSDFFNLRNTAVNWRVEWHEPNVVLDAAITVDTTALRSSLGRYTVGFTGMALIDDVGDRARPDQIPYGLGFTGYAALSVLQTQFEPRNMPLPSCPSARLTGNVAVTPTEPAKVTVIWDPITGPIMTFEPGSVVTDHRNDYAFCSPLVDTVNFDYVLLWQDALSSSCCPPRGELSRWEITPPGNEVVARKNVLHTDPSGITLEATFTLRWCRQSECGAPQ